MHKRKLKHKKRQHSYVSYHIHMESTSNAGLEKGLHRVNGKRKQ